MHVYDVSISFQLTFNEWTVLKRPGGETLSIVQRFSLIKFQVLLLSIVIINFLVLSRSEISKNNNVDEKQL